MKSYNEAREVLAEMSDGIKIQFRRVASARLSKELAGSGQGIGSSDIGYEMVKLVQETDGEMSELVDLAWNEELLA